MRGSLCAEAGASENAVNFGAKRWDAREIDVDIVELQEKREIGHEIEHGEEEHRLRISEPRDRNGQDKEGNGSTVWEIDDAITGGQCDYYVRGAKFILCEH